MAIERRWLRHCVAGIGAAMIGAALAPGAASAGPITYGAYAFSWDTGGHGFGYAQPPNVISAGGDQPVGVSTPLSTWGQATASATDVNNGTVAASAMVNDDNWYGEAIAQLSYTFRLTIGLIVAARRWA